MYVRRIGREARPSCDHVGIRRWGARAIDTAAALRGCSIAPESRSPRAPSVAGASRPPAARHGAGARRALRNGARGRPPAAPAPLAHPPARLGGERARQRRGLQGRRRLRRGRLHPSRAAGDRAGARWSPRPAACRATACPAWTARCSRRPATGRGAGSSAAGSRRSAASPAPVSRTFAPTSRSTPASARGRASSPRARRARASTTAPPRCGCCCEAGTSSTSGGRSAPSGSTPRTWPRGARTSRPLSTANGQLLPWNPGPIRRDDGVIPTASGPASDGISAGVNTLALSGTSLYLGGAFASVNGTARKLAGGRLDREREPAPLRRARRPRRRRPRGGHRGARGPIAPGPRPRRERELPLRGRRLRDGERRPAQRPGEARPDHRRPGRGVEHPGPPARRGRQRSRPGPAGAQLHPLRRGRVRSRAAHRAPDGEQRPDGLRPEPRRGPADHRAS